MKVLHATCVWETEQRARGPAIRFIVLTDDTATERWVRRLSVCVDYDVGYFHTRDA